MLRLRHAMIVTVLTLLACLWPAQCEAGDWPMWRHDAQRSATTDEQLSEKLHVQWVRELPPLKPTWPDQPLLETDATYEPVVAGGTMFVGSSHNDSLTAYDVATGSERWRFYADGPVRFAPIVWQNNVYFASDDGCLYCLNAQSGTQLWRFRGGPSDANLLGHGRLISTWPMRGAPVLADGTIYVAAGIWPFMGIFIHAVDAQTGEVVWTNDSTGAMYITQPHNSDAFAGLAPQGFLAAVGDNLIVPNGRAVPACLDRRTGELRYFHHGLHSRSGGYRMAAADQLLLCESQVFDLKSGKGLLKLATKTLPLISQGKLYIGGDRIAAYDATPKLIETKDRRGKKRVELKLKKLGDLTDNLGDLQLHIKAGSRFYASRQDSVVAIDVPVNSMGHVVWTAPIQGTPSTMLAAADRLLVVTREGTIVCFGAEQTETKRYRLADAVVTDEPAADTVQAAAAAILEQTGVADGYCLVLGLSDGRLTEELVRQSRLHVIAVDPDSQTVAALRHRFDAAGLYGTRVSVHVGDPTHFSFPPYLANLIVSEDPSTAGLESADAFVRQVFRPLRPYGGVACFSLPADRHDTFQQAVVSAQLANAEVSRSGEWSLLRRAGELPGSADWTHQYADAGNSAVSKDKRVKGPLGVLWFGGASNEKILPRHGHGPSPQVAGGRLFIEGPDILRCVDIYTGRVLWEKEMPGLGTYYNRTDHFAGAGEIGSNFVSLADRVYVVYGPSILELDAATGEQIRDFANGTPEGGQSPAWGFAAVDDELLVATSTPFEVSSAKQASVKPPTMAEALTPVRYSSASRHLVIFDRRTGKPLWRRDAQYAFRHNCVVVAAGKVFCLDGMSRPKYDLLKRRGLDLSAKPRLLALDARTGTEVWSTDKDVFGTFLSYSAEHDVLLQSGSAFRDRAKDDVGQGMIAYRGAKGTVLWKDLDVEYNGPCLLWRDRIITNGDGGFQLELLTGKRTNWSYSRNYGCNTAIGGEHFLTFRSAAAGFYDLAGDSGTGNFGGFRSSCTANLIAAGGVMNAPDYTRTCTCGYQNQTSLALIHMPEADMWTFNKRELDDGIRRVGINLGAPGDRRAENGTLWLEYPLVGGPSPKIAVSITPAQPKWFCHHPSRIHADSVQGPRWVAASGVLGLGTLKVALPAGFVQTKAVTIRLHFAEPDNKQPGQRVFSVALQGQTVLERFDIAAEAGGANRAIVKEFRGVPVQKELTVDLTPATAQPVLCGIEVIAEDD